MWELGIETTRAIYNKTFHIVDHADDTVLMGMTIGVLKDVMLYLIKAITIKKKIKYMDVG
jgi:hypothetical protein